MRIWQRSTNSRPLDRLLIIRFALVYVYVACVTTSKACGPGQYFDAGTCKACDAGKYSDETYVLVCKACAVGKYSGAGEGQTSATTCKDCAAGKYSDVINATTCKSCVEGQYSPFVGHSEGCYMCLTAKTVGESTCDGCDPGMYKKRTKYCTNAKHIRNEYACKSANQSWTTEEECLRCSIGKFSVKQNSPKCEHCPSGFFANNVPEYNVTVTFNKCLGCPRGRWGNALGSHNETAGCKDCAQGKYSDLEGMNSAEQCKGCPKGKWSEGTGVDKESMCKNCGPGKHGSTTTGASSKSSCVECDRGRFGTTVGSFGMNESCEQCPHGYSQNLMGQSFCLPCQPGTRQNNRGMPTCVPCSAGRKSAEVARFDECALCDSGRYQPESQEWMRVWAVFLASIRQRKDSSIVRCVKLANTAKQM